MSNLFFKCTTGIKKYKNIAEIPEILIYNYFKEEWEEDSKKYDDIDE